MRWGRVAACRKKLLFVKGEMEIPWLLCIRRKELDRVLQIPCNLESGFKIICGNSQNDNPIPKSPITMKHVLAFGVSIL